MVHTFVKDVMIDDLATLDVSAKIIEGAKLMAEKNIGCIIVTEKDLPVGILTERDFVRRIIAQEISVDSTILDVMTTPLITIDPDETVWEAAQIMKTNNIHKLPVQKDHKLMGIITTTDLVKICSAGSDSEMRRICDQIIARMEDK